MVQQVDKIETFPSGSTLLDCVLGEGWPVGSLIRIAGDSASGKTLVALEAAANHLVKWSNSKVSLCEREPSFDLSYITSLGIPMEKIDLWEDIFTIEDWYRKLQESVHEDTYDPEDHALTILDSLDSLSDEEEQERDIGKGTFGANKAKKMSEAFRRIAGELEQKNATTIIISQLRDLVNSPVPMKTTSGGRALAYYAAIDLRIKEKSLGGKLKRTVKGKERVVGLKVNVKCVKNKVAMPFRDCDLTLMFGYGIDDITSNLEFLKTVDGGLEQVPAMDGKRVTDKDITDVVKKIRKLPKPEIDAWQLDIAAATRKVWAEIEANFAVDPEKAKY